MVDYVWPSLLMVLEWLYEHIVLVLQQLPLQQQSRKENVRLQPENVQKDLRYCSNK